MKTINLAANSTVDELIGNVTDEGINRTRKIALSALMQQILAESPMGVGLAPVGYATYAALAANTAEDDGTPGHVYADADPTKNGIYTSTSGAWTLRRGFPDYLGYLTSVGGSANARTASLAAWVNPSAVKLYIMEVPAPNTGVTTLSVNGETPRVVVSVTGAPLAAGDFTSVAVMIRSGANYKLVIDVGAASRAVNAAAEAAASKNAAATSEANAATSETDAADHMTVALGAAEASGSVSFYRTNAEATAAATGLSDGARIEVETDETVFNHRVRYIVASGDLTSPFDLTAELLGGIFASGAASVFNYLNKTQIADVQAKTFAIDLSPGLQDAFDSGEPLYFPPGGYRLDSQININETHEVFVFGAAGFTTLVAGAAMTQMFYRPSVDAAANKPAFFMHNLTFDCNRLADRAFRIGCSKKGAISDISIIDFLVEAGRLGGDSGVGVARYYENRIEHIICDGNATYAGSTATMPAYGLYCTNEATDNVLDTITTSYVTEAGVLVAGGFNTLVTIHTYGSNSADTGPKYNIVAQGATNIVAPENDNVIVAGIKCSFDSISIVGGSSYWAPDNTPTSGGSRDAVPVEIDDGINSVTIVGHSIRGGNTALPLVRWLGASRPTNLSVIACSPNTLYTPQNGDEDNSVRGNLLVRGRTSLDARAVVDAPTTSNRSGTVWRVGGSDRYDMGTNTSANGDLEVRANNSGWFVAMKHYRTVSGGQWEIYGKVLVASSGGGVGFYGTTPISKQTLPAAASDAATTQTLTNNIRAKLIALGLFD